MLYQYLGLAPDEGLVAAFIPRQDEIYDEIPYRSGTREFTMYSRWGKAIDLMAHDHKPVKWWIVREAARSLKLSWPEPFFSGPAGDFGVHYAGWFDKTPVGDDLAVRQYSRGPWIRLKGKEDLNREG